MIDPTEQKKGLFVCPNSLRSDKFLFVISYFYSSWTLFSPKRFCYRVLSFSLMNLLRRWLLLLWQNTIWHINLAYLHKLTNVHFSVLHFFFCKNTPHILLHYLFSLSYTHTHPQTHTHTFSLSQSFIHPEVLAYGNKMCLFLQILSSLSLFAYLFLQAS